MEHKELLETINSVVNQALANTHTMTIGKVIKLNAKTIDVQPVINRVVNGESIPLPIFAKVPPIFLGGGGSSIKMPVAVGDYVLLMFTERCFDRWWSGSDFQSPLEMRKHDYSDGFALAGLQPLASALDVPGVITITGDLEYTGNMTITGDLAVNGSINVIGGDVVADNISLKSHDHEYTWTGSAGTGITGAPQ